MWNAIVFKYHIGGVVGDVVKTVIVVNKSQSHDEEKLFGKISLYCKYFQPGYSA